MGDCANGIYACYKAEVEKWGGRVNHDNDTKEHLMAAAKWLTDPKGKPGLMLCGLCGNGKTTLARAIQRFIERITELECGFNKGKTVKFMKAKEICRLMRTNYKAYEKLFSEPMLIIDELGEEPKEIMTYGMIDTPMIDLISERYDQRLFTIVTTNLDTDELRAKYGERITDRFTETLSSIIFENDSYRQQNKAK